MRLPDALLCYFTGAQLQAVKCHWHQTLWRAGGKISFDKEANAEIYGPKTTAQQILGAPASTHSPPEALRPLYALTFIHPTQSSATSARCKALQRSFALSHAPPLVSQGSEAYVRSLLYAQPQTT